MNDIKEECEMCRFLIDSEIQSLLPSLTQEEEAGLVAKLKTEGCREQLTIGIYPSLDKPILIDGHHRRRICGELGTDFTIGDAIQFQSRAELIQWVIDNQLSRRNLTDERRAYYRGKEYLNAKQAYGGARRVEGGVSSDHSDHLKTATREQVAKKHNVSPATVARDAKFAEAIEKIGETEPELRQEILNGTAKMSRREVIKKANGKPVKKKKFKPESVIENRYDKIINAFSSLSRMITQAINRDEGENLLKYLTTIRLVVYGSDVIIDGVKKTNSPKFRGFPGLRRVVKLAGLPGRARTEEQVRKEYFRKDDKDNN